MSTRTLLSTATLIIMLAFVSSCTNQEEQRKQEKQRTDSLLQVQQDSLLDAFKSELETIAEKVSEVSVRNGLFNTDSTEGTVLSKETILAEVESLDELLINKQQRINEMYEQLKKNKLKSDELESMMSDMQNRIAAREAEIKHLMQMLADKDMVLDEIREAVDSLRMNNISLTEEIIVMDEEMHLVYYIVGESKELKEKGVVTKEGGVLGLGASKKLDVSQLDQSLFTEVDQRDLQEIPLYSKKAKVITNHPTSSFELIEDEEGQIQQLNIIDRKSFWATTDYLVVEVEN